MNKALLHTDVQEFIRTYPNDLSKLAFAGSPFPDISISELLEQIESRRAIAKKLPVWFATNGIIYPPKVNLEQTSSSATAAFKASLIKGKQLADITGGFGIDSYFFSQHFKKVTHFETNKALSELAEQSFDKLGKDNICTVKGDGLEGVKGNQYDVIYVDPSRRNEKKGKVFLLSDCEPNMPENIEFLLRHCNTLLIKTSPMLDIAVGLKELKKVTRIHVVALQNEVKELLWFVEDVASHDVRIDTTNITNRGNQHFSFVYNQEKNIQFGSPRQFLYEPNAAIMKSGGFQHITNNYDVTKLHKHSHLFTSETLQEFPGRRFRIKQVVSYTKKEMRAGITFAKANITTRNFPESVAVLRKKWKIKEGGDTYLFFTTLENEDKIMLICAKV